MKGQKGDGKKGKPQGKLNALEGQEWPGEIPNGGNTKSSYASGGTGGASASSTALSGNAEHGASGQNGGVVGSLFSLHPKAEDHPIASARSTNFLRPLQLGFLSMAQKELRNCDDPKTGLKLLELSLIHI